jgi:hypothetical protein
MNFAACEVCRRQRVRLETDAPFVCPECLPVLERMRRRQMTLTIANLLLLLCALVVIVCVALCNLK